MTEPTARVSEISHVREIVLVRHGQTARNEAPAVGRYVRSAYDLWETGKGPMPDHEMELDATGRQQAEIIGAVLRDNLQNPNDFKRFYDSGYRRTVETLDLILEKFGIKNEAADRRRSHLDLRERDPGYSFIMSVTDTNRYFPWLQEYEAIFGKFYTRPPGGESVADVCSRVQTFLNSLRRAHCGNRIFIVTHGRVMLAFRFWLERVPPTEKDTNELFAATLQNCAVLRYLRTETDNRQPWERQSRFEQQVKDEYQKQCELAGVKCDTVSHG